MHTLNHLSIVVQTVKLSRDIELNPGPLYIVLLEQRLRHFQFRPFDVGGDGYGDPEHHLQVKAAGIAYMRDNPEMFIENNTEMPWLQYLNNMPMQGTWGYAIIIQAVADQLKLKIVIVQS